MAIILYEPTSAVVHRFQSAEHVLPQWRMQLSSSASDIDLSKMGVPSVPLKGSDPVFNAEGPNRSSDFAGLRNYVCGFTTVNHGYGNHAGIDRMLVTSDDRLEGLHDLTCTRDRIGA